jgi:hypothetical protein
VFLDVAVAGCNACGVRRPLTIIDDRERLKLPSQTLFFGFLILSLRKTRIVLDATARSSERDQLSDGQKEFGGLSISTYFLKYQNIMKTCRRDSKSKLPEHFFLYFFFFLYFTFFCGGRCRRIFRSSCRARDGRVGPDWPRAI